MKRSISPCIIDGNFSTTKLKRVEFHDKNFAEEFLQEVLNRNPDLLPVDEIDRSFGPLVTLGREIDGIDNLFVSPQGRITLVETKLWRNPEAVREVVAQILDYASRLGKLNYSEFEQYIRAGLKPTPLDKGISLYDYVRSMHQHDILPEEDFIDEVSRTLANWRFMLLVVGDGIHENVENLLDALHKYPQRLFSFGLVELQIYDDPKNIGSRLVIPQVIANSTEVVRGVIKVQTTGQAKVSVELEDTESSGYVRTTLSEDDFFQKIEDENARVTFKKLLRFADTAGAVAGWRKSSVSIQLPDPKGSKHNVTLFVMTTSGDVYCGWTMQQLETLELEPQLGIAYIKSLSALFAGVTPKQNQPDFFSRELGADEVEKQYDRFLQIVMDFIKQIRKASGVTS